MFQQSSTDRSVAVARDKDIDLEKKERQRKILDEQVRQKKQIEEDEKEADIKVWSLLPWGCQPIQMSSCVIFDVLLSTHFHRRQRASDWISIWS